MYLLRHHGTSPQHWRQFVSQCSLSCHNDFETKIVFLWSCFRPTCTKFLFYVWIQICRLLALTPKYGALLIYLGDKKFLKCPQNVSINLATFLFSFTLLFIYLFMAHQFSVFPFFSRDFRRRFTSSMFLLPIRLELYIIEFMDRLLI